MSPKQTARQLLPLVVIKAPGSGDGFLVSPAARAPEERGHLSMYLEPPCVARLWTAESHAPELIFVPGQLRLQRTRRGLLEAPRHHCPGGGPRGGSQRVQPEVATSESHFPTAETTAWDAKRHAQARLRGAVRMRTNLQACGVSAPALLGTPHALLVGPGPWPLGRRRRAKGISLMDTCLRGGGSHQNPGLLLPP